jgi:hypothetical protein
LRNCLCAALAIDTCRHNATRIASPLATREEALNTHMLERFGIPYNTYRTARTRLNGDKHRLVGQKSMRIASESLETIL